MKEPGFAKVVIDLPSQEIDYPFEYAIPSTIRSRVDIGSMVLVEFGHTVQIGYVVELASETTISSLNPILEVIDEPVFNRKMVRLCQWISSYYCATLSQALKLALPPGRSRQLVKNITLISPPEQALKKTSQRAIRQQEVIKYLDKEGGKVLLSGLRQEFGQGISTMLKILEQRGIIEKRYEVSEPSIDVKQEEYVVLAESIDKVQHLADQLLSKAPKQSAILDFLIAQPRSSVHQLLSSTGSSRGSLRALVQKGIISICHDSTYREPDLYYPEVISGKIVLTDEQSQAVTMVKSSLSKNEFKVFLLQGVTGSGKTEVYIQGINEVLKTGKTAIVLVPEIALTPQTAHRFRNAFGNNVAVLHSRLGLGERFDQWRRIQSGQYQVVIGARSALFAPLKNLGLIVVDEEHESTYKQNRNPRYHAVDVALKRAEIEECPVILGSATPAVESRYQAEIKKFTHIVLAKRVEDRQLPKVEIVDMKQEHKKGNKGIFSTVLQEEMHKCLEAEGKFLLFINRRGYASFLLCRDCGFVPKCKRCSVSFTYHRDKLRLICHHCNSSSFAYRTCPNCGSNRIGDFGVGTQKVESELNKLIPGLAIIRMDADTTRGKDSHRKRLIEFHSKKKSVLLGTQMIAKGLDFPEVTLVGIINGDTALNLPDFRAAERTFQLLMQVSGRAGRGAKPGKVILQTYLPENYALTTLAGGEYDKFFEQELTMRQELGYPPFCQLINIVISGRDSVRVEKVAQRISKLISDGDHNSILSLLGPAPAPLSKIKNRFRWHIALKVSDTEPVCDFLRGQFRKLNWSKLEVGINLVVDVDPVWML